jgi:hypothetical protein
MDISIAIPGLRFTLRKILNASLVSRGFLYHSTFASRQKDASSLRQRLVKARAA